MITYSLPDYTRSCHFQFPRTLGQRLIKKLIGNNIVVFLGDDIQKIYGFLGAMTGIFDKLKEQYGIENIEFKNNYRFRTNDRMKGLDKFIRFYAEKYVPPKFTATIRLKRLSSDAEEDEFITDGIKQITNNLDDKVAVLVRAGWQADTIVSKLDSQGIGYFNALFSDQDQESTKFYNVVIEEFHRATVGTGKVARRELKKCLDAVVARKNEIYTKQARKFIFDALYKLLDVLFTKSRLWECTSKERYDNIDFVLGSNGLKRMMEFIDEKVVLTTIHSAKGLEWEYVILPKLTSYGFPSGHMCRPCGENYSCSKGLTYCNFTFDGSMKKKFKEEVSVLYVGVTRAKKDVLMTVNTGLNQWNHNKQTSCLINLKGLSIEDYEWNDILI